MNIAKMNIRIMIQENRAVADETGNRTNVWTDYFSCYATASAGRKSGGEEESARQTAVREFVDFTVRYCRETAAVSADRHRIILGSRIYNIISVDDMAFRNKSMKFHTERVKR